MPPKSRRRDEDLLGRSRRATNLGRLLASVQGPNPTQVQVRCRREDWIGPGACPISPSDTHNPEGGRHDELRAFPRRTLIAFY
jgi:hypothetical protein